MTKRDELRWKVQHHFYLLPAEELVEPHKLGWWAREADQPPPTDGAVLGGWLQRDKELSPAKTP